MKYFIADPAGNITAFVFGQLHQEAAEMLLASGQGIEQVAFLNPPENGGHIKCDMAGGEFCGNACRAAGYFYAVRHRLSAPAEVLVEMSGGGALPVRVTADREQGISFAHMPLPLDIVSVSWAGLTFDAVVFDGITHLIAFDIQEAGLNITPETMHELCSSLQVSAVGVMFLDQELRLKPVVWVDQVASLVWESSCGSGSTACAWWLSRELTEGSRQYRFRQPGGTLEIRLNRHDGDSELMMGGRVMLQDDPFLRELEL